MPDKDGRHPAALYCGRRNAFALTREPADAELPQGIAKPKSLSGAPVTNRARTGQPPTARRRRDGRNGTARPERDRPVKERRPAGISAIGEAARFPGEVCLPKTNGKFPSVRGCGRCPRSVGNGGFEGYHVFWVRADGNQ
jgi:hypothetical protein